MGIGCDYIDFERAIGIQRERIGEASGPRTGNEEENTRERKRKNEGGDGG